MRTEDLIAKYPKFYHMAEDGSWPNIKIHGLLSTSCLLEKWEYPEDERIAICVRHRPNNITIENEKFGKAVLRDQKAINPEKLKQCLVDTTEESWYHLLNNKVFFWPDWQALIWFLGATAYFGKPHVVITVDTRQLLLKYKDQVTLSSINSGSTYPKRDRVNPEPRGLETFKNIPEYPLTWIKELAIDDGIKNIVPYTTSVERLVLKSKKSEPEKLESLWQASSK